VPGVPTWYTSTCRECPAGCGIHVETHSGARPRWRATPTTRSRAATCARAGRRRCRGSTTRTAIRGPSRARRAWPGARRHLGHGRADARRADPRGAAAGRDGRRLPDGRTPARWTRWWTSSSPPSAPAAWSTTSGPTSRAGSTSPTRLPGLLRRRLPGDLGLAGRLRLAVRPDAQLPRTGARGKFVWVGPHRPLTGLNADQWIAPRPGTEACSPWRSPAGGRGRGRAQTDVDRR
jgi:hypothetical protein